MMTTSYQQYWQSMTEQEQTEWLAVNIMGWERHPAGWRLITSDKLLGFNGIWNPHTDHNHYHMIEEMVMEDDYFMQRVLGKFDPNRFKCKALNGSYYEDDLVGAWFYLKSTLPEKLEGIYIACQEKHKIDDVSYSGSESEFFITNIVERAWWNPMRYIHGKYNLRKIEGYFAPLKDEQ